MRLPKEVKDHYDEDCRTLMEEIGDIPENRKDITTFMDGKNQDACGTTAEASKNKGGGHNTN